MHQVGPEETSDFDAFERGRGFSYPMRIKDLYHRFIQDRLTLIRLDWDNMSDDAHYLDPNSRHYSSLELELAKREGLSEAEQKAHLSFKHCQAACQKQHDCFQYRYYRGICSTSTKIKLGQPTRSSSNPNDPNQFMSGWDIPKIRAWVREHDDCGGEIVWPKGTEL